MQKKSIIEMERSKTLKIARTLIRLKHSLAADEEINSIISELEINFNKGIQTGDLKTLVNPAEYLKDV